MRAACCRFPFRKLACEKLNHRINLHASHLGTFQPGCSREFHPIFNSSFLIDFQPASWLVKKAAASCTHSKASLRMPMMGNPHQFRRGW
jgi:hypothetical protein